MNVTPAIPLRIGLTTLALLLASCGGGGGGDNSTSVPAGPPPSRADTQRFLEQAAFGPTDADVAAVQSQGFSGWISNQFVTPSSGYPGYFYVVGNGGGGCQTDPNVVAHAANNLMLQNCGRDYYGVFQVQRQFFANAQSGKDQLRQRVAFALSQIIVTSGYEAYAQADYQQMLLDNAFGNFRDLLTKFTLHPTMGDWLDMVNNDKPNPAKGIQANENYARELLQLFTIGLSKLNLDGSVQTDANGKPIPTYGQTEVTSLARAFTGWTYPPVAGAASKWTNPLNHAGQMVQFDAHHDTNAKTLLDGQVLPAGQNAQQDLNGALDIIFNHPNVGPFVGKQLIQKLVTGSPSPAYVQRVAAVFNNNGKGVRGDMQAVVRAILLDSEARGDSKTAAGYGRLREPALYLAGFLRSMGATTDGVYTRGISQNLGQGVYASPSVFNFYPPSYLVPGTTITGPEFSILDTSSALGRMNFISQIVFRGGANADASVANAIGTHLDLTGYASVTDAGTLTDQIADRLLHGQLPAGARTAIVNAVTALTPASIKSDPALPAKTVAYLIATSPLYQVER